MNGDDRRAIGALEGKVEALCDRMDRAEENRTVRHKEIFDRLGALEASAQFNKGRMSWIGWVFTLVALSISAGVAALVTKFLPSG